MRFSSSSWRILAEGTGSVVGRPVGATLLASKIGYRLIAGFVRVGVLGGVGDWSLPSGERAFA